VEKLHVEYRTILEVKMTEEEKEEKEEKSKTEEKKAAEIKSEKKEAAEMGTCSHCGSEKIEVMTRVTGFFSKVNSWNKGKIGELKKRRTAIRANQGALDGSGSVLKKKEKKEEESKEESK